MASYPEADLAPTKTESCVERRCQIKWMFLEGGEYSTAQLAQRFGVTDDTIRRDLASLGRYIPLVRQVVIEVRWKLMQREG